VPEEPVKPKQNLQQDQISLAKNKIDFLIGIFSRTKEVVIGPVTFVLRTLESVENREAQEKALATGNQISLSYEYKYQALARALVSIDGVPINSFLNSNSINDRVKLLGKLGDFVSNKLLTEFEKLNQETTALFSLDSPKLGEEIAEDLKK
jgi:hypothetical protein